MPKDKLTHADKDKLLEEKDAQIAELGDQVLELEAKLAELESDAATPVAPPPTPAAADAGAYESLGSIDAKGMLFLGSRHFSEEWAHESSTGSIWCLDFYGDNAESFAKVAARGSGVEQLGPDLWRCFADNRQYAQVSKAKAVAAIREADSTCVVKAYPKNCTRAQALDASRGNGFGFLKGALVVRGGAVTVEGKTGEDGQLKELLLKL